MGNSSGNLFPVLASDICLLATPVTRQKGRFMVGEERMKEVYITKYPARDRWFTNLSNIFVGQVKN
jgi:hypothetical protein